MLACPTCPPERLHHRLGEQLQPAAQMNAPPPSNSAVARKSRIAYDLLPPRNCSFPNSTRANCNNCLLRCRITFVPATVVRYSGAFESRVFRASLTQPFVLRPTKSSCSSGPLILYPRSTRCWANSCSENVCVLAACSTWHSIRGSNIDVAAAWAELVRSPAFFSLVLPL